MSHLLYLMCSIRNPWSFLVSPPTLTWNLFGFDSLVVPRFSGHSVADLLLTLRPPLHSYYFGGCYHRSYAPVVEIGKNSSAVGYHDFYYAVHIFF